MQGAIFPIGIGHVGFWPYFLRQASQGTFALKIGSIFRDGPLEWSTYVNRFIGTVEFRPSL